MIEASTSAIVSVSKSSIHRDIISEWIIVNSVLSKALEGKRTNGRELDFVLISDLKERDFMRNLLS